jgi:hypothetical protein
MHPLAAKLLGLSAVKNLETELAAIERRIARFRDAAAAATNEEAATVARAGFLKSPTPETAAAWVFAESQKGAAQEVTNQLRDHLLALRQQMLADAAGKIEAAVDEASADCRKTEREIVEEDLQRTQRLGEPVESVGPLSFVRRQLENLETAKGCVSRDPAQALGLLKTASN